MENKHPDILRRCKYFTADRGYNGSELICRLWDKYSIKSIIDVRKMWKDGEKRIWWKAGKMWFTTIAEMFTVIAHELE